MWRESIIDLQGEILERFDNLLFDFAFGCIQLYNVQ